MTSAELKVATLVKYCLVDVRIIKKPSLKELVKSLRRVDLPSVVEVDVKTGSVQLGAV
jgi:hypothetical protein